ncbi:hypothetical protein VKT23_013291 [Stygiomarasmius scandens]|uniref:ferric-chelate reductase (NADPH) n=1 Tax=Marasmiellus scandens TaxID=2682957 RepID=A0ABR1J415_9AGAR
MLFNMVFQLRAQQSKSISVSSSSFLDRVTAGFRYTIATQYRINVFGWYSPPLAAVIAVTGMFIFVMSLMLAVRPYYWPKMSYGHSMPIATRSGWISIAIMPFMIAFSTKVNWVGLLTATSHEKLQVFHHWSAAIMYVTSLVHTFPFIIMSIRQGEMELNWSTDTYYWTGVVALVPQTWLVFASWGVLRNKYYETFKKLHFIAAAIFMIFLFLHCDFRLTSWDYFWATLAIYMLAFLARIIRTVYNSSFGLPASVEALPDGMLRTIVKVPARVKWTPGQHIFVRFVSPGIHAFSSHPFTIASIPSETRELELVFGVQGGITKALDGLIRGKASKAMKIWIDGPYGGVPGKNLGGYDHVYLLAGGSGVTFTLSILMDLVQQAKASELKCGHIEFILAVKSNDSMSWLEERLATAREAGFTVIVHVTREEPAFGKGSRNDVKIPSSDDSVEDVGSFNTACGRPNIPNIIRGACRTNAGTMAVAACGPDSFLYDVRNSVADCQLAIADGYGRCKDLFLHTENYSW